MNRLNPALIILCLIGMSFTVGCKKSKSAKPAATAPVEQKGPQAPQSPGISTPPPSTPAQPELASYPTSITVELLEKNGQSFNEPITVAFTRFGTLYLRNIYVFKKSYLGPVDDRAWFWWQQGDDVIWSTPWAVVSVDLSTMKVLGGAEAGKGLHIGNVIYDGKSFRMELLAEFSFQKDTQQLNVVASSNLQTADSSCPQAVKMAGMCTLYSGIYDTLRAIDFAALGELGPGVANDVVSFSTAFALAKSVYFFKPDVEHIRIHYLVPLLKAIGQIKKQKTQAAYSNLLVTSVDTLLKTQKMMPEAGLSAGKSSVGVLLAYLGANGTADKVIGHGNPPWFEQLVSPIIREFGVISLDIVLNGSNTPMAQRIDRLIAMEDQVRDAVRRLCRASPTSAQNECLAALNQ